MIACNGKLPRPPKLWTGGNGRVAVGNSAHADYRLAATWLNTPLRLVPTVPMMTTAARAATLADSVRGTSLRQTRRWREPDSNHRSPGPPAGGAAARSRGTCE